MLETFDDLENKIILKDLNLFLDFVLEAKGGGPVPKKNLQFQNSLKLKKNAILI